MHVLNSYSLLFRDGLTQDECDLPVYGISSNHHIFCTLAQVKEKLQLISQYQLIPLQLLIEEFNKISCTWWEDVLRVRTSNWNSDAMTCSRITSPFVPLRRWATASLLCWNFCSLTTSSGKRWRLATKETLLLTPIDMSKQCMAEHHHSMSFHVGCSQYASAGFSVAYFYQSWHILKTICLPYLLYSFLSRLAVQNHKT